MFGPDQLDAAAAILADVHEGRPREPGQEQAALDALHQALVREQRAVFALCRRVVRNTEQALELAQESFLVALQRLHTFRGESSFRSWLLGITRFTVMNAVRKKKDYLAEDGVVEVATGERPITSLLRKQERERLIVEASAAVLDSLEQEAVYLRYVEGVGQDEITRILQLTNRSGARGLLVRCRRKLKVELESRLASMGHSISFVQTGWA